MKKIIPVITIVMFLILPFISATETTVDPTADGATTQWTTQSGTDHYAMIDDAVRDPNNPGTATYITGGSANNYDIVTCSVENVGDVSQVIVHTYGDDAMGGVELEISKDGTNWETADSLDFGAGTAWDTSTWAALGWNGINGALTLYLRYKAIGTGSQYVYEGYAIVTHTDYGGGDTTPPNVTIRLPLNQTYNSATSVFNVTSIDADSSMLNCSYSLNAGVDNFTLTNSTPDDYDATNSSMAQGGFRVYYYCWDDQLNLNNTEYVDFTVAWGGDLITMLELNENIGTTAHDNQGSNNGTIISSTWENDGINKTLTNLTDYFISGTTFTIANTTYAWNSLSITYLYQERVQSQEVINDTLLGLGDFGSWITVIIASAALAVIITILFRFFGEGGRTSI